MGILAAKLFKDSNIITAVYTFGAPRVGDPVFKSNYDILTRGIVNKGFSGFRGVVARTKFCFSLIGKKPAIRCASCKYK